MNKAVYQIKIHKMNNLDCYLRDLPDESVDQLMLAWIGSNIGLHWLNHKQN